MCKQNLSCRASARLIAGASLLACGLSGTSVLAATQYLDTNGATPGAGTVTSQQTWNTAGLNWTTDATGSVATSAYVDGSDAVFSAGDSTTGNLANAAFPVIIAGGKVANSITIKDGTITFNPSTTAATRTIGAGGITLTSTAGGANFTNVNGGCTFILSASQAWTNNNATAALSSANPINTNAASGTTTLTASANGAGNVTFSGILADGATAKLGLTATSSGAGKVVVSGATTYSGGTTVTAGGLLIDNGGSLAHSNINITGGSLAAGTTGAGGSLTDNLTGNVGELISLSGSGVLDLTNIKFTLAATGSQTLGEYVLANHGVGSAFVTGTAFASTVLPSGWSIDYDGTTANPGDIVLINSNAATPEPATLGLISLGVLGLARRRRA